jgi:hypothetical protein
LSRAGNKVRGKSGRFHLSAIASYISNTNKACDVLAVNLSEERGELYSQLNRHSASVTRANGRIAETFIISFDARMSDEHQREALNNFLMAVTFNGQTRATAYRHNDHEHNPHAHVILIDTDENGEPVGHFGRSGSFRREHSPVKGNPTVWLRKTWQDECNAVLEANGYEFRIDMRSNLERGIAEAQKKRGLTQEGPISADGVREQKHTDHVGEANKKGEIKDLEPAPECPPMPVDAPEAETYPADLPREDDMADIEDELEPIQTPKQRVQAALYFRAAKLDLLQIRSTRDVCRLSFSSAQKELETAQNEWTQAYHAKANAEKRVFMAEERSDGKVRGARIKIGSFEWKSEARKQSEQAQANLSSALNAREHASYVEKSTAEQLVRWDTAQKQAKEKLHAAEAVLQDHLTRFGQDATLETAEGLLEYNVRYNLDKIRDRDKSTGEEREDLELVLKDLLDTEQITEAEYNDALGVIGGGIELDEDQTL